MYYDRQIKYFDYKKDGIRQKGAGFMKIEVREDTCTLSLQLSGLLPVENSTAQVYGLWENREEMLGNLLLQGGRGNKELRFARKNETQDKENRGDGTFGPVYEGLQAIRIPLKDGCEVYCQIGKNEPKAAGTQQEAKKKWAEQEMPQEPKGTGRLNEAGEEVPTEREAPQGAKGARRMNEAGEKCEVPQGAKGAGKLDEVEETTTEREVPQESNVAWKSVGGPNASVETEQLVETRRATSEKKRLVGQNTSFEEKVLVGQNAPAEQNMLVEQNAPAEQNMLVEQKATAEEKVLVEQNMSPEQKVSGQSETVDKSGVEKQMTKVSETRELVETERETPEKASSPQPRPMMEEKWEQLWAVYPHLAPFGDEREYLQMGLGDFVILRERFYRLVHNSFLLHGFYNYQHLILTRLERRGENFYYIGVPGNFYDREKQVALMYGFESFECAKEPAGQGDFGYYMIRVEL